jgi:hypothetical protein
MIHVQRYMCRDRGSSWALSLQLYQLSGLLGVYKGFEWRISFPKEHGHKTIIPASSCLLRYTAEYHTRRN